MKVSGEVLQQLQRVEFDILQAIDTLCSKYDIPYFLAAGTCIGAVRHKGFIPWDDDIDIGMARDDYERFVEVFHAENPSGYWLAEYGTTPHYPLHFVKVCKDNTRFVAECDLASGLELGIFVDIFPYDYVNPALSDAQVSKLIKRAMFWQRMMFLQFTNEPALAPDDQLREPKRILTKLLYPLAKKCLKEAWLHAKFEACIALLTQGATAQNATKMCCVYDLDWLPKELLLPPSTVEFEGKIFSAPHDTDAYLTMVYGDYMTIPAPQDRKVHVLADLSF